MSKQPLMNEQQIIQNLKLLGEELEALQIQRPVRLLMIGGAYMITQFGNRTVTEDVDVFTYLDKETEDYRRFRSAIHFIADDVRVSQKWVSDNIGDFMQLLGLVPDGRLWLKHGMLKVYIPEPHYILMLKLVASRDKDVEDIQALCRRLRIKKRAQLETWLHKHVKKYQIDEQMIEDQRERIDEILRKVFEA